MELILFLLTVAIITLSGALMPGPTIAVTIAKSYHSKFAGVKIALGHIIAEAPLIALVYFGFGDFFKINLVKIIISLIGGMVLFWMGLNMIKKRKDLIKEEGNSSYNPVTAGIVTTAGNPSFFLWWATIGIALIMKSALFGLIGFILFTMTHWLCDFGAFFSVSLIINKTKHLYGTKVQEALFGFCGLALLFFGLWFLWSAVAG